MARQGKLARLRKVHRDKVCELLQDGASASTVIEYVRQLAASGEKDADGEPVREVDDNNVSRFRAGGFEDWKREHARLDDMRIKREAAMEIVKAGEGGAIQEASLNLAATQLYEVLTEIDLTSLKEKLQEKPELYPEVIRSLAPIAKGALDFKKYRDAVTQAKVELQKLRDPKQELGDAERQAIVEKVDEILGLK